MHLLRDSLLFCALLFALVIFLVVLSVIVDGGVALQVGIQMLLGVPRDKMTLL